MFQHSSQSYKHPSKATTARTQEASAGAGAADTLGSALAQNMWLRSTCQHGTREHTWLQVTRDPPWRCCAPCRPRGPCSPCPVCGPRPRPAGGQLNIFGWSINIFRPATISPASRHCTSGGTSASHSRTQAGCLISAIRFLKIID